MIDTLTANHVVVATGCAPKELPFAKCDGTTIISSYDAMNLPARPQRMVVVGSGASGMEFAYFYNRFGTEVNVVDLLELLLEFGTVLSNDYVLEVLVRTG